MSLLVSKMILVNIALLVSKMILVNRVTKELLVSFLILVQKAY